MTVPEILLALGAAGAITAAVASSTSTGSRATSTGWASVGLTPDKHQKHGGKLFCCARCAKRWLNGAPTSVDIAAIDTLSLAQRPKKGGDCTTCGASVSVPKPPAPRRVSSLSYADIRMGDRVTYVDHRGQEHTGKAVMRGPAGWVLNLGGAHGTPGICDADTVVRVVRPKGSKAKGGSKRGSWHYGQSQKNKRELLVFRSAQPHQLGDNGVYHRTGPFASKAAAIHDAEQFAAGEMFQMKVKVAPSSSAAAKAYSKARGWEPPGGSRASGRNTFPGGMDEAEWHNWFLEKWGNETLSRLVDVAHNAELAYRPKDDPGYWGGFGKYKPMYDRMIKAAVSRHLPEAATKAFCKARGWEPEPVSKRRF